MKNFFSNKVMASYRCTSNLEVALLVHQVFELLWYDSVGKKKGI